MSDAHTVRLTALFTALTTLGPQEITELMPITLQDLLDDERPIALETARNQLITATFIAFGGTFAPTNAPRRLALVTVKATRWVDALMQQLGGIVVNDLLTGALVAAAAYQLAMQAEHRDHVTLDEVATSVLTTANTPA